MSMSRKSKIWALVLPVPVVLVIAAVVALKVMFTSERLKSMVIPRAEAATGRTVGVNDISLSVFPSIALNIEGVSVSNRRGEGFSSAPFLTLDGLRVNVKLLPLLKSRVEVTSLELDRPRILLEVNARNESNYSDLTGGGVPPAAASSGQKPAGQVIPPPADQEKPPVPGPSAAALLVSNLLVNQGSVEYINHKDNSATIMRNLFLSMQISGEGSNMIINGNAATDSLSYGTVETPLLAGLRLRLDHRVSYDLSTDRAKIERGDLTFQDMRLSMKGSVSHVRGNSVLDLSIGSDSLNIAELFSLIPREYMKKAEGVKGTGIARVHIAVTGTLTDSTSADLAGTIAASGASLQYPQLPRPITDITILSSFSRTKSRQEFRIEKLTANLGGAPVHMALTMESFTDPVLELSAGGSLNLATVPEYYPLEKGTELGGGMDLDLHVAGKLSAPKSLQASGAMTFRDVSVKTAASPKPVRRLNGTLTFNNDEAEAKKLSLVIGESDMTISCSVRNYLSLVSTDKKAPQCTAAMTLVSNHLYARDIMTEQPAPAGTGQKAAVGQPAAGPAPVQKGAQALATPHEAAGGKSAFPLPAVDIDANATIGTLTMEKFEFTNIRGAMRVSKGIVTMQNLSLNAFGGGVVTNGSLDLNKPERPTFDLSLNLNGVEASALLSHFTSFGQRLSGALTTTTSLKGALNDTLGLVPESLQGSGKVALRNGTLKGYKVNQSLASQLKLPDLDTLKFKDWGNDYTVQNGRLVIKDLTITASTGQYVVNGSQGLDGSLDYRMALYLPESAGSKLNISGFAGEAVNLFKDQNGRLKLDFNIGGTTDNPKVQLDTGPAQKRAEEMAKQKLQNVVKDKAGDVLKKLFKK